MDPDRGDDHDDVVRSVELSDGRRLVVRAARPGDAEGVAALYGRLSVPDLEARFFSAHQPGDAVVEGWVSIADHGGLMLVAEVVAEDGSPSIVAEAGYALLPNGDGELGITVDPGWRGWLAPWLLDALAERAAASGVANLEADVLLRNRKMLALLGHRGRAVVDHPDWRQIRLVISTTGRTPSWPEKGPERPHVLVAEPHSRWADESAARAQGFDVRTCPGPDGPRPHCPVLEGRPCPLVEGADAIVFALPAEDPRSAEILADHRRRHPDLEIVMTGEALGADHPCDAAGAVLDRLVAALLDADDP